MFIPDTSFTALLLIVLSMFCWASWPNLLKALPGWRLEYFYVDYTIGFLIAAALVGATAGSTGLVGLDFVDRLLGADREKIALAVAGGVLWNAGNIFLLNSIMIVGLAVAFPIGAVLAITLGVGISYWAQPVGHPVWLLIGCVVLVFAAYTNARAYRDPGARSGAGSFLGIALALAAGVLVGVHPPLIGEAIRGEQGLDAYTVSTWFMIGAAIVTAIGMPLLVRRPFIGPSTRMGGYLQGPTRAHLFGLLAGAVWCVGTIANFASAGVVGMAISWGIASGAPMVGALWGILLWHEFRNAGRNARALIAVSLALYTAGVVLVAIAYFNG